MNYQQPSHQEVKNENYNHVLDRIQDYMLYIKDDNNINKNDKNIQIKQQDQPQKQDQIKESNERFFPKENDSLFWCFFIIKYGFSKYEYPGTTDFVNEKNEKFKCIENIRLNKQQLKIKKIKNIREDVEDELANKQIIGMKTFIALCISNNINIMFIQNRKCFELIFDDQSPIYVVHCFNNNKNNNTKSQLKSSNPFNYCYELNVTPEQLENYRTTLFNWESVDKPLKAISSYKLEELMELCKKLDLNKESGGLKSKSKKELYELIIMNL